MIEKLEKGIFLKRINRFTIKCRVNEKILLAYLPNPGRLWELLIPNRIIYLKRGRGNLPFTVWAVKRDENIICLHTHYTNLVAENLINKGLILKCYRILSKEKTIRNSRVDFLISKDEKAIPLEVKSCTLYNDSIAMFPDAITVRGRRHVELLSEFGGGIIFIVHCPDVKYFLPDFHTDPLFSKALYENRNRLMIKAFSLKWDESLNYQFIRQLDIPWHIYEKEAKDRGSYLIIGYVNKNKEISIGRLGSIMFQEGYYIYVGSAMSSLSKRLGRYHKKKISMHWHIDYLLPHFINFKIIPVQASETLECSIAKDLSNISDAINSFGSSDCNCTSHLYYLKDDPFTKEEFINIILKYRINRLSKYLA